MARKKRKKGHKKSGHSGLRAQYAAAKRAYHSVGDKLYRAGHDGRSIHQRKRKKTKHKKSR